MMSFLELTNFPFRTSVTVSDKCCFFLFLVESNSEIRITNCNSGGGVHSELVITPNYFLYRASNKQQVLSVVPKKTIETYKKYAYIDTHIL